MGDRLTLYLADACALIDFYTDDPDLPAGVASLFEKETGGIAVLATTVWEIAIKIERGKLTDIRDPDCATLTEMLGMQGYVLLPFDHVAAERAARLPPLHGDPFDRALVAEAQRTGSTVLTYDAAIARYGVPVRWRG